MDRKDFYYLGKIVKTSGYQGSLMFFFDVDNIAYYKDLEAVFVDVQGALIPFAIQKLTLKNNNSAYVKLEEVNSEEEAVALVNCEVLLPLSFLPTLTGNKFYYHEVIGFQVIDKKFGDVGIISSVMDTGPQDIFSIIHQGKEILLPISDNIILQVDRDKKTIQVDAPDGLIDLYLSS